MVDLLGQYKNIKTEIDRVINSVIKSSAFIRGPEVRAFEEELADYLGVKHVIGCANGTDALQIAMMGLGLNPGDEVITTDFTFIATVEVIALLGLKPVFVDPDPVTFNISVDNIKKAITERTKVILPVHLFGQCADMNAISALAEKYNLFIIEDTAQATGAEYSFPGGKMQKAGTIGDVGTTSFFPSKNLGCYGDGGALFTNNDELAVMFRSIANHGMTKKYYHDHIGVNSRLDSIQAAILRVKLKHLDEYNSARQRAAGYYDQKLGNTRGLDIPARATNSSHIFHQYTLKIKEGLRDKLRTWLQEKDIPSMIYYPVPLHRQQAYSYLNYKSDDLPHTNNLAEEVLSLPMHTELTEEVQDYICNAIGEFFDNN